ncbi:ATP-binding protein [Lutibaculum baratangense]|nr:ATP-binding protein [Lutibaculum baratangense]
MDSGIVLGTDEKGLPARLDLEELLSTRLLVQGNSGSGKSHLLRRLLEQSAGLVQQAIIDPEGDFVTLAERYGHIVVDANRTPNDLAKIANRIRHHRASVVLDLEGLDAEVQMRCAAAFLNGIFDADREAWYPMLVAVDEAQLFAPAGGGEISEEARRASLGAMTNLMCRGRKRGLAGIIATQRLAKLAKNVAAEASNFLMGRTFLDIDMARASDLLGMERRQAEAFRDLAPGQFVALGPALSRRPLRIKIGDVVTRGRSGRPELLPLPETPREDLEDLIFQPSPNDPEPAMPSQMVMPMRTTTDELIVQVETAGATAASEAKAEAQAIDAETLEAALDEIFAEILSEPEAAFRPEPVIYQDFQFHCRVKKLGAVAQDMATFRRRLALGRAGVSARDADDASWSQVLAVSENLPVEMQGVFLMLARSAGEEAPCPSDESLARAYGSHSPSRARWLLTYMENQGYILCETDFRGQRVVSFPGVGWRTAPSAPKAAQGQARASLQKRRA